MSTADLSQQTFEYERLLTLLAEYTKKMNDFVASLPDEQSERVRKKQQGRLLTGAVKKLAQTASQRLTFPEDYLTRMELELRLAELETALAAVDAI